MSGTPTGRFAWYELMTTDPKAAPGFYEKFTGWSTAPFEGSPDPYDIWMNGETPIGGLMELPQEAKDMGSGSSWLAHISTPDLGATCTKAQELGGTVMNQMAVPDVGSFAIIMDPVGAVFSAYQPDGDTPGHDGPPALGEFSWNELMAKDGAQAWAFYSALFGWVEDSQMDMGPGGIYQMFKGPGGRALGGMMTAPEDWPPGWLFYIHVESVGAAVDKINAGGGTVVNGPMEIPGGDTIAMCSDPQGAAFAVHGKA